MALVKLQFEVRYTRILEFGRSYRKLLVPYAKSPDVTFTIQNANMVEEYIVLVFKELGFIIDVRWDRMFIIVEGEHERIDRSNGVMKYFFEIYEKIKSIDEDGFGSVLQIILGAWFVVPKEDSKENVLANFHSKYLDDRLKKIIPHNGDYLIQLNSANEDNNIKVDFGPYTKKDLKKYNLSTLGVKSNDFLEEAIGEMCNIVVSRKKGNCNFSTFKEYYEETLVLFNKLQLQN